MSTKADSKAPAKANVKKAEEQKKPAAVAVAPVVAAARPLVTVYKGDGSAAGQTVKLPQVMLAPIRNDIVHFVHTNMAKNRRQAYGVSYNTGMQHSAESWGTGRAVARIPRISGGGTSRAGQGAFGNQTRGGRMFAPTKIWRKWHRKINQNQKRYAVASALAASAITSLVLARGHRVEEIPEVPLVVSDEAQNVTKTKQAIEILEKLNAYGDVEKAKNSRKLRCGKGKIRNRRHVQRRGPLVVFNEDNGISQAFRNLPGVELCQVDRLNLLQLAPGGHLGRFVIWTKAALQRLDEIWGSTERVSTQKKNYTLPRTQMLQSDLTRLINSDEVQSKVRPAIKSVKRARQKKNPLTNLGALVTLNPYALALRRSELLTSRARAAARRATIERKRNPQAPETDKNAAAKRTADKKAQKVHKPTKSANFKRIAGQGTPDRKPVVIEEPIQPAKDAKDAKAKPASGTAKAPAASGTAEGTRKPAEPAKPAADATKKPEPAKAKEADKKDAPKKDSGKKDGGKKEGDASKKDGGKKEGDAGKKEKKDGEGAKKGKKDGEGAKKGGDGAKKGDGGKKGGDGGKKDGGAKKA